MRTFLINTSPQRVDLSAMAELTIGLEEKLTILNADCMEALEDCVRNQAFNVVQHTFGSDYRLNMILYRELAPGPEISQDINDRMRDVLEQEEKFVRQAVERIRDICAQENAKLELLTFLFGERCSHGMSDNESRATLTNRQGGEWRISVEDPTRMQDYFRVRFAFIDMDHHPRNQEIRKDWYFYLQLMLFACLEAQGVYFPLNPSKESLNGDSLNTAFPLPDLDRDAVALALSRKIAMLKHLSTQIQMGKYDSPPREEDSGAWEKKGDSDGLNLAEARAFTPNILATWKANRRMALALLDDMAADSRMNLEKIDGYRKKLRTGNAREQVWFMADFYYNKLAEKSANLAKTIGQTRQGIAAAVQPLHPVLAGMTSAGGMAALYVLLYPFGLAVPLAPLSVMAVCLLGGTGVFNAVLKAGLFPEMLEATKAYKDTWGKAEKQMKELLAQADMEGGQQLDASEDRTRRMASWHLNRINRLVDALSFIANNAGVSIDAHPMLRGEQNNLNIQKGMHGNAAVYGFTADEYKRLYMPGGKAQ